MSRPEPSTTTAAATRRSPRRRLEQRALLCAQIDLQVPFPDVDAAQIVWHGNYFRYFEAARAELLRRIGYDYPQMRESGYVWPLIDTHVRFIRPLHYAQWIRVGAGLIEWENRLRVDYEIRDRDTDARLALGSTVQCAVARDGWELQLVSPRAFLDLLEPWL
jgi:acyl-CoA thioester hydrolase